MSCHGYQVQIQNTWLDYIFFFKPPFHLYLKYLGMCFPGTLSQKSEQISNGNIQMYKREKQAILFPWNLRQVTEWFLQLSHFVGFSTSRTIQFCLPEIILVWCSARMCDPVPLSKDSKQGKTDTRPAFPVEAAAAATSAYSQFMHSYPWPLVCYPVPCLSYSTESCDFLSWQAAGKGESCLATFALRSQQNHSRQTWFRKYW